MTRILALDTTGAGGSIALLEDCFVIEEIPIHSPGGFAHVLFGEIESLLSRRGFQLRDIGLFAAASGPGSFTGVRVGLAAAKGLAEACGCKVAAVSNLRALAYFGTAPLRATVIDARRGEIFGAVYGRDLEIVCPEIVAPFETWLAALPPGEIEFIAQGYSANFPGPVKTAPTALAGAIGAIAATRIDLAQDPAVIDANYVRRSDAELLWKGV